MAGQDPGTDTIWCFCSLPHPMRGKEHVKKPTNDIMLPKCLTSADPFEKPKVEKLKVGTEVCLTNT